ncbi:hypothetical protein DQ04_13271000 [Trypanosoma grayi]|uniref:hypothetical protein n=1 Tax=Trypanosoma grayi TaxID=71804 RepID=UPI0004F4A78A|nr:hypothetical protein DQ04_13271000 [Trypanosoma grayi]KEG06575.1 hypothetical protein DQ04_13271000 [Trypanosoma grayi]
MQRRHSATNGFRAEPKQQQQQQPKRGGSAGVRRAVVQDTPQDEVSFYTQRLSEMGAQHAKLEREYQQRLAANRRAIRQLHDENTHLRTIRASAGDVTETEMEQLEQRKFLAVRRLNRLTHQLEKVQRNIGDAEATQRLNEDSVFTPPREAVAGSRSVALRIQKLEKRLDKMLAEQQCIATVKGGYAEILQQLQEEGINREARVLALQRDVDARHQEYARLVQMYNNATADYQRVEEELRNFTDSFHQVRRMKDKALTERREHVERALRETRRLEQLEVELRQEMEDEQQRIEEAETEQQTLRQRRQRSLSALERLLVTQPKQEEQEDGCALSFGGTPEDEERVRAYEEAFRNMMHATGASTLDELVTKYELEYATRLQLQEQERGEQQHLDALREEVRRLKEEVERHTYCGAGPTPASACLREELVTCIDDASRQREDAVEKSAALQQVLAEVMRRVDVLADSVAGYRMDVRVPPTEPENLVTHLQLLEQKIMSLADEAVSRGGPSVAPNAMGAVLPPGNTRVKLPHSTASNANNISKSPDGASCSSDGGSFGIIPTGDSAGPNASVCSSVSDEKEAVRTSDRAAALLDIDEPLGREQIKRLAAVVLRREARRQQREEKRV